MSTSASSSEKKPEPKFVQPKPHQVHLEPGKEYYWCSCGESKNQPFCDGSHRAAGEFKPKKITVDEPKTYYLCGCKYTHNEQGFCDGTHRKEEGIRKYNEFLLKANQKLKTEKEDLELGLAKAQRKQKMANIVAGLSAALIFVGITARYYKKY